MNKILITFFTVLLCLSASVVWSLEHKDLVKRHGVYYKKFTEVPFTGKVDGFYKGYIKNGKREGSWIGYHLNGQLMFKVGYKNGRREGVGIYYHENGQLNSKGNYKNGNRNGYFIWYNKDGTNYKKVSGTYKDGIKISN